MMPVTMLPLFFPAPHAGRMSSGHSYPCPTARPRAPGRSRPISHLAVSLPYLENFYFPKRKGEAVLT